MFCPYRDFVFALDYLINNYEWNKQTIIDVASKTEQREYTPENITSLKPNEIFVFGSNTRGNHAGGAAKLAYEKFGAIYGVGHGFQGQSYAIPTLSYDLEQQPLEEIKRDLEQLIWIAERMPSVRFWLTPIGTGIAGYKIEDLESILPKLPNNIVPTWLQ